MPHNGTDGTCSAPGGETHPPAARASPCKLQVLYYLYSMSLRTSCQLVRRRSLEMRGPGALESQSLWFPAVLVRVDR